MSIRDDLNDAPLGLPATSLVDVIRFRSELHPESPAFTFLNDGEDDAEHRSFAEFDEQCRAIGAWLQQHGAAGKPVLLLHAPGIPFLTSFFGCFYAGAIAVPAYPPRMNTKLTRLQAVAIDSEAAHVLTDAASIERLKPLAAQIDGLNTAQWIDSDEAVRNARELSKRWRAPLIHDDTLAFLQYTSGSTGQPKGVMLTHRNLMHNQQLVKAAFRLAEQSRIVCWLPLYHDMGLIGNIMHAIYTGSWGVLMSPIAFIQRPFRWLQAITRYRGVMSGAPNFAYELCLRKVPVEQRAALDLSSWRIAFNGAEPVRPNVVQRFMEEFEQHGFSRSAFHPCYGLAEGTVLTTARPATGTPITHTISSELLEQQRAVSAVPGAVNTRTFVGCGGQLRDQEVIVVDPDTRKQCEPEAIGEIWVRGPSVARGYWKKPELTAEIFHARLADNDEGPFLRTGDLGFMKDGELYITGRLKDLIIINGRNHYPQDIEQTIEQTSASIRPGCVAVVAIEVDGEERLVTLQEIERTSLRTLDAGAVEEAIRKAVAENHEVEIYALLFLKPGSLPKTTSGKLQRRLYKQMFLAGEFTPLGKPAIEVTEPIKAARDNAPQFSLLYFSSNEADFSDNKYELLIEGAKFADQNDFTAVWVPERHFHAFGGLYPNPSVLGAALATVTERIRIRAGSVVLPLHNPVRVAEEWSVVDNLSHGRVDLAFARGWNPNDFVFAPQNYENSTEILFKEMQTVRGLWRGETLKLVNGTGKETEIRIHPLPQQRELAYWITCSGGAERFKEAGACGANVLTALLFQSIEELAEKIAAYREARAKHGHDPNAGHVTLMMHTFIDDDMDTVRRLVREPFIEYLKTSVSLWRNGSKDLHDLNPKQQEELLAFAFERYFQKTALFGTPATCLATVKRLQEIGVDEIACLIDFGIDTKRVLRSLEYLNKLKLATKSGTQINADKNPDLIRVIRGPEDRELQELIVQHVARSLRIDPEKVPLDKNFYSLGVSSLKAVEIIEGLSQQLGVNLSPTILFEAPTVAELAKYFARTHAEELSTPSTVESQPVRDGDIAVIGMGCRFPNAPNLKAFWELLRDGKDAVTEVPADHWDWRRVYDGDQNNGQKTYSRWGGFLDDIDQFDPFFFNISHREARLMDPQQRIFLEVSWEALEHAGYSIESLASKQVGVFVGSSNNGYYRQIEHSLTTADHAAGVGNQNAIIANRVSFTFNFHGPSVLVDTICSASLVALHTAMQSLRTGECDIALTGGVNILLWPEYYVAMSRMKAHSPDGRCKTFDHRANGIVFGEGAGALLLKPLRKALEDGDAIYAVIKGSAVNHDGQTNGLTAPNPEAQAQLITRALQQADVTADTISYLEAHGTGTSLGDPIEIEGASRAFRKHTDRKQFCAIGSVKTNIGHLEPAAGVCGVIKVILSMQHGQLPPTLNFEKPNPHINFNDSPFRVNTELRPWNVAGVRRAGVSSFGIGGTNAHVIVEEAPSVQPRLNERERPLHVLTLSAKSENALRELARHYVNFLEDHPHASLANVCFTANTGRSHFAHRLAVVAETISQLSARLQSFVAGQNVEGLYHGCAEIGKPEPHVLEAVAACGNGLSDAAVNGSKQAVSSLPPSSPASKSDWQQLLDRLSSLYVAGGEINWQAFDGDYERQRVALPTYPFERERCWIEAAPRTESTTAVAAVNVDHWLYEIQWRRQELRENDSEPRGAWIVLIDDKGTGTALAQDLEYRGETCFTVRGGDAFSRRGSQFTIDPANEANFDRLLAECNDEAPVTGVVHAWSLDADETMESVACASLVRLVQAIDRQAVTTTPRIWIITQGAQSVGSTGQLSSVSQSLVWGVGRVLSLERPQNWGGLIDLEDTDYTDSITDQILSGDPEDQVAFRGGHRYVPRLVHAEPRRAATSLQLRPDATYLITGGLGSLGLRVARWMVDHGARHLVLLSRRSVRPSAIDALEARGAKIEIVSADVADEARMSSVIKELPSLRGIVHAAGMQTPQSITEMDLRQFDEVLRPKVNGALILHKLTASLDLDFMIFFSSMSAVLGSIDLAHYAAANQFLDALAHHRRALGLPALSINWGPWAGDGMVNSVIGSWFERLGVKPLAADQAVEALTQLLHSDSPQVTVADVDWQTFKPIYESRRVRPLLNEIVIQQPLPVHDETNEPSSLALEIADAPEHERHKLLRAHVSGEVADILGQDRPALKNAGFFELGMDSLMAMELKRRLENSLGCVLSPTLTFDYPNIDALVQHLLDQVLGLDGHVHSPEWLRSQTTEQVLATVEDLSDDEALTLLEEKLKVLEGNM